MNGFNLHVAALCKATETYAAGGIPSGDLTDTIERGSWFGRGTDTTHGRRLAAVIGHDPGVPLAALVGALGDRIRRRREDQGRAIRSVTDAAARGVGAAAADLANLRLYDTKRSREALAEYAAAMSKVEPARPRDVQPIGRPAGA